MKHAMNRRSASIAALIAAIWGGYAAIAQTPNWTAEGNEGDAHFGISVASAGDVNGDGYDDVIVGANFYDAGQSWEGRVFVYLGSPNGLSTTPTWTAESNQSIAHFGTSVGSAGDVNGDGFDDVIIGAPYYDNGAASDNEGWVFVWHGSACGLGPNGTPANAAWSAQSNDLGAFFGWSVSAAGDVNGDGFGDIIVGAHQSENDDVKQADEGRAFVWLGSASGLGPSGTPANADWFAEGEVSGALLGQSVAAAGDVNNDGFDDLVIGAPGYDIPASNAGRTFVWYGSSLGLGASGTPSNADWQSTLGQGNAQFGFAVASAGDVNGDGFDDVIVGAPTYTTGPPFLVRPNAGAAAVFHGSATGLATTYTSFFHSDQNQAELGRSVAPGGDVNGDGYDDVIIGIWRFDAGQIDEGATLAWFGSASGLVTVGWPGNADWFAEGDQASAGFGISVAGAGDVNNDDGSDVMMGAWVFDGDLANEGKAFVYHGGVISDCNGNGVSDASDIAAGTSLDCNSNELPDECEGGSDCNANGVRDGCDIAGGTSADANGNGTPDECETSVDLGFAPCPAGRPSTTDPPMARVVVTVLSVNPETDLELHDDFLPFYDDRADIYGRVIINGEVHNLPKINHDNFPHWDSTGPRNGRFVTQVTAVPDPSGLTALPVPITIEIMESDGGLPGDDDDIVDINPASGPTALNVSLDLCSLKVTGDVNADGGTQGVLEASGGSDDDDATIRFKVELEDGRPVSINDLALIDIDLIQVVPQVSRLVAGKPTILRYRVANNYSTTVTTQMGVMITGSGPAQTDIFDLPPIGPGEVQKGYLYTDSPLIFPPSSEPYEIAVLAIVDDGPLPENCANDCRGENNSGGTGRLGWTWTVVTTDKPSILWAKVGLLLDLGNFAPDAHFQEIAELGGTFIRATYPVDFTSDTVPGTLSFFPLYGSTLNPVFDWLSSVLPYLNAPEPFLMVADLGLQGYVAGYDRVLGVLPNKDWFERFAGWSEIKGVSLGDALPRAVIFVPRMETEDDPGNPNDVPEVGPQMTLPAHELGHTYGLSTDSSLKDSLLCNFDIPVIATLLCGIAGGFDEYKHEDPLFKKGNPANGYWVTQGGEPLETSHLMDAEQCDSHCFMGGSPLNAHLPGFWSSRGRWIDRADYEHLLDKLTISSDSPRTLVTDTIYVSGMVTPDGEVFLWPCYHATGARRVDRLNPDFGEYLVARFLDGGGNTLAESPLPLNWPFFHAAEGPPIGPVPVSVFGLTLPFPAGTRMIQILRHEEDGGQTMLAVRNVSTNPPMITEVDFMPSPVVRGQRLRVSWDSFDPDGDTLSYTLLVSLQPTEGWMPVTGAHGLTTPGFTFCTWPLPSPPQQTLWLKVIAHDGIHMGESAPVSFTLLPSTMGDTDGDGQLTPSDLEVFALCMDGPQQPTPDQCSIVDLDCDADVDLADFRTMQLLLGGSGTGVPAATVTGAVSRKNCDLPLNPAGQSEPREGGVTQVRISFDVPPAGPGSNPVTIEQATCAAPTYVPYSGASTTSASVAGNNLVLTFTPSLENARTYRITVGSQVTSIPGQVVTVRGLLGDVNGSGRTNASDRSFVVSVWTSPANFSCATDLDGNGRTHAPDRSLVVASWTSGQNCAP